MSDNSAITVYRHRVMSVVLWHNSAVDSDHYREGREAMAEHGQHRVSGTAPLTKEHTYTASPTEILSVGIPQWRQAHIKNWWTI